MIKQIKAPLIVKSLENSIIDSWRWTINKYSKTKNKYQKYDLNTHKTNTFELIEFNLHEWYSLSWRRNSGKLLLSADIIRIGCGKRVRPNCAEYGKVPSIERFDGSRNTHSRNKWRVIITENALPKRGNENNSASFVFALFFKLFFFLLFSKIYEKS